MIKPPWYNNPIEISAFNQYAYHQQIIEDFINLLAAADDPNDISAQASVATTVNLNINSLTRQEREYIEREVVKRKC